MNCKKGFPMWGERFLEGKVAIVTGGGRGIGAATAAIFAQAGAAITVAARTAAEVDAVAQRIRLAGGEALAAVTDISDATQVQTMVQRTIDTFSHIDFLINCAAVVGPLGKLTWESDPKDWQQAINVDLLGVFLISRAVLPHMLRQGAGRLLFVSSPFGELVVPRSGAYSSARSGANHFIRILAAELHGTGVSANIVYPGVADTQGLREFRIGLFGGHSARLARPAQDPADPARLLLWLCSRATAYMNGQTVVWNDPIVQRRVVNFLRHNAFVEETFGHRF
jgi:NAD(P)-dependent dehydrogenase (short-subunit alcohol dehydrogenase family)